VAGVTSSFGAGNYDMWVLKLDGNGNPQWQKSYGGGAYEVANCIQQTSDGGYIVTGGTSSFRTGNWDVWVLKLDGNGNPQWQKTYGGVASEQANFIQQTSDGGYIVAGGGWSFGPGNNGMWVLKLDGNGNIQWQKAYLKGYDARSIQQTSDGGYIVAGYTWIPDDRLYYGGSYHMWVLKLDPNGNIQWQKAYGGNNFYDYPRSIKQTSDGGYIMVGSAQSPWGSDPSKVCTYCLLVYKLDGNGNPQWQKAFGGSNYSEPHSIVHQTSDGGYILTGSDWSTSTFYDGWVLKLDGNGNIQWRKSYCGAAGNDILKSIQLTSDGGYIAAGSSNSDAWVLKLDGNGEIVFNSSSGMIASPESVTVNDALMTITVTSGSSQDTDATPIGTSAIITDTNAVVSQQAP
jgi:hypothetical protein